MDDTHPHDHGDTIEDLIERFGTWKNGTSKAIGVTRACGCWTSIIASMLLIWVLCRSHIKLASTFHRLLLGICISDLLYSMGGAHFNYLAPKDNDYMVWNANGSMRTCDAIGFITALGSFGSLLYTSSLNLYCLVVLKFNKSDEYIKNSIGPWLNVVPVAVSLAFSVLFLVFGNYNDEGWGVCWIDSSSLPHCDGYGPGQIREGFEIPCEKGKDSRGVVLTATIFLFVLVGMIPIMLVCVYRAVRQHEKRYSRVAGVDEISMSWMVLSRVCGYSYAYLLMFSDSAVVLFFPGKQYPFTLPAWFDVMAGVLCSLLGLFHFFIYMHPRIIFAIEIRNCSCCQAMWFALSWRGPPLNDALPGPQAIVQQSSTGHGPTSPFGFLASNNILLTAEVELVNSTSTQNHVLEQVADVPDSLRWPQENMQQDITGQEPVPMQENHPSVEQQSQEPTPVLCSEVTLAGVGGERVTEGTNRAENSCSGEEQETAGQGAVSIQRNNVDEGQQSRGPPPAVCSPMPVAEIVEGEREERRTGGTENSRSVLQHILQAGVVEAIPEREDEEEVLSERTHLLDKMSRVGLFFGTNSSMLSRHKSTSEGERFRSGQEVQA